MESAHKLDQFFQSVKLNQNALKFSPLTSFFGKLSASAANENKEIRSNLQNRIDDDDGKKIKLKTI
jgi:hypothetical protein